MRKSKITKRLNGSFYRKKPVLGIIFLLGALALIFGIYRVTNLPLERRIKVAFQEHLTNLSKSITDLPGFLRESGSLQGDLEAYDSRMASIRGDCNQLQYEYGLYKDARVEQPLKDLIAKVDKLCVDLLSVAQYSQDVYRGSRPYLLLDSSDWPTAGSDRFNQRLSATKDGIAISLSRLKQIKNTPQDPALDELITQVDLSATLVEQIEIAVRDDRSDEANSLAEKLLRQSNQDKADFLNARLYFWNNTIRINDLQKALDNLNDQFE
jgi:hypothetical protein